MLNDLTKLILTGKAIFDVIKEKLELKAADFAMYVNKGDDAAKETHSNGNEPKPKLQEKAKEELLQFINEITHKVQINELQLKGYIKDKLTELTNNALLDSVELNDIRADIASLRAEIADLKEQMKLVRR